MPEPTPQDKHTLNGVQDGAIDPVLGDVAPVPAGTPRRRLSQAESYTPELLQDFLLALERTESSLEVWKLIVGAGAKVGLPFVDFVSAGGLQDWRRTLFMRTSYDSSWLQDHYRSDDVRRWSYFRHHAMSRLTPVVTGIEFADEYDPMPEARLAVLREAAARGLRSGFSIPLRQDAPPRAALITFSGPHGRREMRTIVSAHGWALHAIAMMGHQRYLMHFRREFTDRNHITPKQLELLKLIGQGLQDKRIAEQLEISVSAVRQRMAALCQNTGLKSRSEIAALAMSLGVLPDPLHPVEGEEVEELVEMDDVGPRRAPPLRR
ncbi:helix-turn-helix transcriptional regulator [Roseivivax isoporae]|uniref:HTH luxR-type domain-containing protein n=1 Tax=Roseivivax isoporae LMG 25204 TaxID=1449351 RepID=X7FDR7_9RHOB|nr:autoinducer binding domain-containing protein [Roseivivax isoporae]ETX30226.1 hypothetical protein RISW2_18405 [Roseivivax isoporae LMG 25204]